MPAICRHCEKTEQECILEGHHLIPQYMGGTDLDGKRWLCHKCHNIVHHIIEAKIFTFLTPDQQEDCRRAIGRLGEKYCNLP